MRLFPFLFFCLGAFGSILASANAPHWLWLDHGNYLPLEEWSGLTGFHSFTDPKSGRILLDRQAHPPLILLAEVPYALQGGKFLALPQAPVEKGGKVLLSAESAERLFLPVLAAGEGQALEKQLRVEKEPPFLGCGLQAPVRRVFLDPGHGGDDSGTRFGTLKEKDIVLKFARLAADELRRRGFEVSFSRTKDVYLPLDIRDKIARKWKADIFISLHVNSSPKGAGHGTETYMLSPDATDAEARKLALLENALPEKAKASASAVQDILWDMEQNSYLQDSAYLASYIQGEIVRNAKRLLQEKKVPGDWKNRGVRQAPFYVLDRAPMPAVLVELGYLSNARDRKLLTQKYFQESLAKALAEGVEKYKEACRVRH